MIYYTKKSLFYYQWMIVTDISLILKRYHRADGTSDHSNSVELFDEYIDRKDEILYINKNLKSEMDII